MTLQTLYYWVQNIELSHHKTLYY